MAIDIEVFKSLFGFIPLEFEFIIWIVYFITDLFIIYGIYKILTLPFKIMRWY